MTLTELLCAYVDWNINLKDRSAYGIGISVRAFERWHGGPFPVAEFNSESVLKFMRHLQSNGRAARTCNTRRQELLTLWRFGYRQGWCPHPPGPGDCPKLREPYRQPTAWSIEELESLLRACRRARTIRRIWTPNHWLALVGTVYDTSLRIGALLQIPRCDLSARGFLICRAEFQKQDRDTVHRLHAQTIGWIDRLPVTRRLFPWPLRERAIFEELGKILDDAGLPSGRRDKFHRLRRTSYTAVAAELGIDAATEHAGHKRDLSAIYLDRTKLDRPSAVDVIARPKIA